MAKSKSLELVGQKFGMLEVVSLGDVVITPNGKDTEKNRTYLGIGGNYISLGDFADYNEAVEAREKAEKKYFAEFAFQREEN